MSIPAVIASVTAPAPAPMRRRAPTPVPAKLRQQQQQQQQKAAVAALEKKATKKRARGFRQRASGLNINILGCRKSIKNVLGQGTKVEDSAPVVLAALLDDIVVTLLLSAADHANASGDNLVINSSHLQKAITSNSWLRTSGLVKGRVLGAARSATVDANDEQERDRKDARAEARNKKQRVNHRKRAQKILDDQDKVHDDDDEE